MTLARGEGSFPEKATHNNVLPGDAKPIRMARGRARYLT